MGGTLDSITMGGSNRKDSDTGYKNKRMMNTDSNT